MGLLSTIRGWFGGGRAQGRGTTVAELQRRAGRAPVTRQAIPRRPDPDPVPVEPEADPVDPLPSFQDGIIDAQDLNDEQDLAFIVQLAQVMEQGHSDIELPPTAALDVMRLVDDPKTNITQISDAISSDPALAGAVLRMANSAMYRGAYAVTAIHEAIVRLGQRNLRMMLLTVVLGASRVKGKPFEALSALVWRHSLLSARLCQRLAESAKLDGDTAYMCGLFHNVGVLATLSAGRRLAARKKLTPSAAAVVETVHRHGYKLNSEVAAGWKLEGDVLDAMTHYRTWQMSEGRYAAVVQLSNDLSKQHGLWVPQQLMPEGFPALLDALELDEDDLPDEAELHELARKVDQTATAV